MEATTASATAPSAITPPQHMLALKRANEVRRGHASLKRDLRSGRITFASALTDPRARGRISVGDLLKAQPRWGRVRTRKFLMQVLISEMKCVEDLTERQRQSLIAELPHS